MRETINYVLLCKYYEHTHIIFPSLFCMLICRVISLNSKFSLKYYMLFKWQYFMESVVRVINY